MDLYDCRLFIIHCMRDESFELHFASSTMSDFERKCQYQWLTDDDNKNQSFWLWWSSITLTMSKMSSKCWRNGRKWHDLWSNWTMVSYKHSWHYGSVSNVERVLLRWECN